jgi:carbon monoxide dehydrogenase subunit G
MLIEGSFAVVAAPQDLLIHLFDPALMASCLPGCEALERLDADRYRTVIGIAMAGIRARFDLLIEVTDRNESGITAITRGDEGGNASSLHAVSVVNLLADAAGTVVNYRSDVNIAGRLGRFALGMM